MSGKPGRSGRPSIYTEELADEICNRLADGEMLRAICRDEHMPDEKTVRNWAMYREDFSPRFDEARKIGYLGMADEIVEISDEAEVTARHDGEEVRLELSATAIGRNKLRVDTRKWVLAKALPKIFGDKMQVGGAEDLPPVKTDAEPTRELARLIAFALHKGLQAQDAKPEGEA